MWRHGRFVYCLWLGGGKIKYRLELGPGEWESGETGMAYGRRPSIANRRFEETGREGGMGVWPIEMLDASPLAFVSGVAGGFAASCECSEPTGAISN